MWKSLDRWHGQALSCILVVGLSGCAATGSNSLSESKGYLSLPSPFSQSSEDEGTSRVQVAYARWQEQLGNLTEARSSYESVLGENPRSVDAIMGLARLDQMAGRNEAAREGFLQALKLKPYDPQVLSSVGQYFAAVGQPEQGIEYLERAMRAAPDDAEIRFNLGVALARSGRYEASMTHLIRAVGDAQAHYNLGLIKYEAGDHNGAEHSFLQAAIKNPELSQAQLWLDEIRRERDDAQIVALGSKGQPAVDSNTAQHRPTPSTTQTSHFRPASATQPPREPLRTGHSGILPPSVPQPMLDTPQEQRQNQQLR